MYRRTKVGQKCLEDTQRPSDILTHLRFSVHNQLKPIVYISHMYQSTPNYITIVQKEIIKDDAP
jgi:hypothetical protein